MTTILITDNKVYSDSMSSVGNFTENYNTKKVFNLGDAIVAGAGRYSDILKFVDWIAKNLDYQDIKNNYPDSNVHMEDGFVSDSFLGLVLYKDGCVNLFEGCDHVIYDIEQPVAIGSGSQYARAAYHASGDAIKAMTTAIFFDTHSGGDIVCESLEEERVLTREDLEDKSKEEILNTIFPQEVDEQEELQLEEEQKQEEKQDGELPEHEDE